MVLSLVWLAGCYSSPVEVDAYRPSADDLQECGDLLNEAPKQLAGQSSRAVDPSDSYTRAWGDPAILMRCGVPEPSGFRPTSTCLVINDIGWFERTYKYRWVFTTITRSARVEVTVPADYSPPSDALVDLSHVITQTTTATSECV